MPRTRSRAGGGGGHRPGRVATSPPSRREPTSPATRSSTTGRPATFSSPRWPSAWVSARARTSPTRSARGSSRPTSSSGTETVTGWTSTCALRSTAAGSATTRSPTWRGASRSSSPTRHAAPGSGRRCAGLGHLRLGLPARAARPPRRPTTLAGSRATRQPHSGGDRHAHEQRSWRASIPSRCRRRARDGCAAGPPT